MILRRFDPLKKRRSEVLGVSMADVEHGKGDPIVLLHGNPTRRICGEGHPALSDVGRCIAPDLTGMGDSAKVFRVPTPTPSSTTRPTSRHSSTGWGSRRT